MEFKEIKERYYELGNEGKREEGIDFLEESIKEAGDNVSAELLSLTGNAILIYTNRLEDGIEYFHRAIEKEPDNPDIYWTYFTDLDEITDNFPETIDDAILCLTKVIEISEEFDISNSENKGKYNYIRDDFDKELSIARRYRDLAVIYMKIPDYDKAKECIDKTLQSIPEDEFSNSIKKEIAIATGDKSLINRKSNLKYKILWVILCMVLAMVIGYIIGGF